MGEIGDRKDRLEDGLQPFVGAAAGRLLHEEELIVRCLLNLDEVRHLCYFFDGSEKLSYALATDKRLRHRVLSRFSLSAGCAGASPNSRIQSPPSGERSGAPRP